MLPLPLVSLILGLFLLSAVVLAGLIALDNLAERRGAPKLHEHSRQLSLDSLIQELTAYA